MYFKVALLTLIALIVSGCSAANSPKPKANNQAEENITVVEEIAPTPEKETSTEIIIPVKESKVVEKSSKARDKYNLKPEPFSLDSNEDDPELLGPQTTLSNAKEKL